MAGLGYTPITRPAELADQDVYKAWVEYTGVPAAITGGLGAIGFNVASQAGQVKTGTSIFSATRYGYGLALLLESSVGTMIFATVMTAIDPEHKHSSGVDETRFYKEHLEGTGTKAAGFLKSLAKGEDRIIAKRWL